MFFSQTIPNFLSHLGTAVCSIVSEGDDHQMQIASLIERLEPHLNAEGWKRGLFQCNGNESRLASFLSGLRSHCESEGITIRRSAETGEYVYRCS